MTAILSNFESSYRALDTFILKFRLSAGGGGREKVEPIAPLVESETLGLL